MRILVLLIMVLLPTISNAQSEPKKLLSFEDFMQIVQTNHPIAKQAEILLEQGESTIRKARGGFDPKLFANSSEKDFKDLDYFRLVDAGLKIPTWIGLDIKAGYERNTGVFLNPENNVPNAGLWFAEFSLPLGEGLFIDKRRTEVKKAELFAKMNEESREIVLNDLLLESGQVYWDWFNAYNAVNVYRDAFNLSGQRLEGVIEGANLGERPAIDTLEARIQVQTRLLALQEAELAYKNSTAQLAVYLWANGVIPLEIESGTVPFDSDEISPIDVSDSYIMEMDSLIGQHPLLQQAELKIDQLRVDVRLRKEELKPTLNLSYKPITEPVGNNVFANYSSNNFEWGLEFSVPLFLRKERGNIQLANQSLKNNQFELATKRENLLFKAKTALNTWSTTKQQIDQFEQVVLNYSNLLKGEIRKFETGESSLFLVNSRESGLVTAQIKLIDLYSKNRKATLKTRHAFGQLGS